MSLDQAEVIDLVGESADGKTITLYLVATEPWPPTGEGTLKLQAKLKTYVAIAADGQLTRQFPVARGKRVVIDLRSDHPLGATEEKLVSIVRERWCEPEGIALQVSIGANQGDE
jgi:hypothetical protein